MHRTIFRLSVVVAFLLSFGGTLFAQSTTSSSKPDSQMSGPAAASKGNPFSFTITGLRVYWLGIIPTGLDMKLDYRLPPLVNGLDSIIELTAGAGYEKETYFRNANGSPYTSAEPAYATAGPNQTNISLYDRAQAIADLGLRQGIIYNPAMNRNRLEAFAFYRFHYDHYFPEAPGELIFSSPFPDNRHILSNSLLGGLDYDTLAYDKVHKTYSGIYAETSLEWGPRFLFNGNGDASFLRWNFTGKIFRTLYTSATPKGMNRFSLYAGEFFAADYATGSSIPIYVQQTFGGRVPFFGLGDAVRGFEVAAWDTQLKAVNSIEIRAVGPAIFLPSIVPGLYAFFDSGYYNGYFGDQQPQPPGGFLASTGVGFYLVSLDLADITAVLAFPVYGQRIDKALYNITFYFSLHF